MSSVSRFVFLNVFLYVFDVYDVHGVCFECDAFSENDATC
jgi:hypothetical protein